MIWKAQNSFSGGVISEKLFGRNDLDQYLNSVAELKNFKVLPHGGIQNRSGTRFAHAVKDSTNITRLIKFEFSQDESYAIELGDRYARFYLGGFLVEGGGSPIELVTPYLPAELFEIDYVQTGDVVTIFHQSHRPRRIVRLDDTGLNWAFEESVYVDGPYLPINVTATTLVSSAASGAVTLTASTPLFAATDVDRVIRIEDTVAAGWAWGTITAFASTTSVSVDVVEGSFPVITTDNWKLGKFSETTGWPSTGMYYEQRMGISGSHEFPQDIDFSQTDYFEKFQTSLDGELLATDAVGIVLYSPLIDFIQWLRPTRSGLAVGTSGGCWIVTGAGGKDDAISPSSINARKNVATPSSSSIKPVQMDNATLFVNKSNKRLHEFTYSWEEDNFLAPDMTLLAEDLFSSAEIVDMDASQLDKTVWCVMGDGRLLGLTYMRAESVVAWHTHETDGYFESVAVVSEGETDVVYCVVRREVGGVTVRYVEYLEQDFDSTDITQAFFVDSGIVSTGQTISGLDHLEGLDVVALADGKVCPSMTVSSGVVTLPYTASRVHVGLPFDSVCETLPLEINGLKDGSSLGRMKDVAETLLLVTKSHGCNIGRDADNMEEVVFNENLVFGAAPELFSGHKAIASIGGQPDRDVRIRISQDLPLPLMVNSMVAQVTILEN